jgi:molybdate transport system substrate-binding protein
MGACCALLAAAQLTVFAASSLRDAFQDLGRSFEQQHPGTSVSFNFAGSQELRTQVEHGARADVLASADPRTLRALADAGLALQPQVFARNEPVIVVPAGNPAGIHSLADLPRARRLVVGAPEVPIGEYTVRILEAASRRYGPAFGAAVEARIASRELNVRQVLAKVALGEADAAIVYRTDALASRGAAEVISIPLELNVVAEYPIAVLRDAPTPGLARAFVELVLSSAGQAALARHGFQ